MFSVSTLIDQLNSLISSGSLDEMQLLQTFGAIESLETRGVVTVFYEANLPPAASNKGRFYYIQSTGRYAFSNGSTWNIRNLLLPFDVNLYMWGFNSTGQLADNTVVSKSSPVSVSGSFTDWVQVSSSTHSVAVRANGTAWAWGYNANGRLGDGTVVSKSSPVSVVGGFTDWIQVSAGGAHSAGVRANGTAWGWGLNTYGRIGDNTVVSKTSPVSVVGGFTDWKQISAGSEHTAALRANGSIWSWGRNNVGQLGDNVGTTLIRSSPVSVVGGFTDWIQVSAGGSFSLGLRSNGTAWAWGIGANGRLGDNTTVTKSSPVSVVGGFTDWIQVSASNSHGMGLRQNGTVWAWGSNLYGKLGDNSTAEKSSPVSVVGGFTDWVQVSGGTGHSIGLRADGTAWAWGNNTDGRLGDNTAVSKSSPVSVAGGLTDWIQVSAGTSTNAGVTR